MIGYKISIRRVNDEKNERIPGGVLITKSGPFNDIAPGILSFSHSGQENIPLLSLVLPARNPQSPQSPLLLTDEN